MTVRTRSIQTFVGNRLPNGKWPAIRRVEEVIGEYDSVSEAAQAAHEDRGQEGSVAE